MYISSTLIFFGLLAIGDVLAANLYRGDSRGPNTIKGTNGFQSKGDEGTVFEHVEGLLKHPNKDKFISTSNDIDAAKAKAGDKGFLYTLDSDKISKPIHDVAAEYAAAGKKYGHADEKEFSVENEIPFEAITKIEKNDNGVFKTLKIPTKRSPEWQEDAFME